MSFHQATTTKQAEIGRLLLLLLLAPENV